MKTTMAIRYLALALGLLESGSVLAGSLDPPATPPAPTMATLEQIYDRVRPPSDTCFENTGALRFVDCATTSLGTSNGTVKDMQTGLIWLKNADCFGYNNWANANIKAATLADGQCGLADGSEAGDWRLPTKEEWQALAKPSCSPPALPDAAGTGCYSAGVGWATGVLISSYWSSTTTDWQGSYRTGAWRVGFNDGNVYPFFKVDTLHVWPVRDGR